MLVSPGRPRGPHITGMPFHWQSGIVVGRRFRRIELDVVADEEIEMAVAVVVEKGAAGAPAELLVVKAGLASDVGKGSVSVVVEQDVVSPEAAEQVVPAVVVVVADADAGLPAGASQAGFFGDIGERSVAIVLVQMRGRSLARRPVGVEARAIGEIDVEPAVVVVIEEGQAAAFGFNDVALVIDAAPDVGSIQSGFAGYVDEM